MNINARFQFLYLRTLSFQSSNRYTKRNLTVQTHSTHWFQRSIILLLVWNIEGTLSHIIAVQIWSHYAVIQHCYKRLTKTSVIIPIILSSTEVESHKT